MNALVKTPILCRDDLTFTKRDDCGRMVNWPRNNPGVATDWEKGIAFFDSEIAELSANDETAAYEAIRFAITGMGGRTTNLELGFADAVAKAAALGLRAMRNGAERFAPIDFDGE
ncbi:hypothetical protein SAMN02745900_03878 [Pseudomonas sp. URIL14HWK12:I8]|uniref:hypothetical protein n=1 Tax=unclassified Pseudomonas TaxID=196821 RepID=UPI000B63830C|nr:MULTISPECIES: hypothetical protein [unclassified Pseudomonas]SNB81590.1 hypothetical protein SAMN02745900_03878 [Pseudomonas sp. URIL14HWK12:I8]